MKRALVVAPGRGSYGRNSLGTFVGRSRDAAEIVNACDAYRSARGVPTVTELDGASTYRGALHVAGEHASLLTFAAGLADLAELNRDNYEVVGVVGNSMGWYTALAAAGALSLADAITLVDTMGSYQAGNVQGGQLLYPITGSDWEVDPARVAAVDAAIGQAQNKGHIADWSIRLGSHAVIGADKEGLAVVKATLPSIKVRERTFPLQLPLHSAFHTQVLADTASRAREELDLDFRAPNVPLIDGRGEVFRPLSACPNELRSYTLGAQVTDTFDLNTAVHTALSWCAPDVVIALGPGNALGGPLARMLVHARWGSARDRIGFEMRQEADPLLLSYGVPAQRALLVG